MELDENMEIKSTPPQIHMFLWKIEKSVIPSKRFLKHRLHQMIDTVF